MIAAYGRTLKWVLQHQTATLLVTAATLVLTIFLYIVRAQGIFSGAGYRGDSGDFGCAAEYFV